MDRCPPRQHVNSFAAQNAPSDQRKQPGRSTEPVPALHGPGDARVGPLRHGPPSKLQSVRARDAGAEGPREQGQHAAAERQQSR